METNQTSEITCQNCDSNQIDSDGYCVQCRALVIDEDFEEAYPEDVAAFRAKHA